MIRKALPAAMLVLLAGLPPSVAAVPRAFIGPSLGYVYGWHSRPWYPGPGLYPSVSPTGELKIKTNDKDARVYINGGYLGIARNLKKFTLWTGNYDVELRDARDHVLYSEKVAILPGRTTEFDAVGVSGASD